MSSPHDVLPEPLPACDSRISEPLSTPPAMGSVATRPPWRRRQRFSLLASGCLLILLCAQFVSIWPFAANVASAASKPKAVPGHLTLQQFLREGVGRRASAGSFSFPFGPPQMPLIKGGHPTNYATLPPSAQPPTMKPLTITLSAAFLAGNAPLLDLVGSDHHLEVQLAPGSLDLSHASVAGKGSGRVASRSKHVVAPTLTPLPTGATTSPTGTPTVSPTPSPTQQPSMSGPLTLKITQVQGIFVGQVSLLAQYRFQITDTHGYAVNGITLTQPMTLIYHYDPTVLASLDFDPNTLYASWPAFSNAARAAHQSTARYIIPLRDDPKAHTLTGHSQVLINGLLDDGNGNPANQAPPTPLVAAMQGNSGQLSYSYPLTVAPGPLGTMPNLNMVYSSQATNERDNQTAPANDFGEGWSLSLGSISADEYPAGSAGGQATWYSLSGVDNISDLLVPNPQDTTEFLTEHISYLRIRQTSGSQPCFNVWDTSGTEYFFGCTSDSLQYYTTSDGTRHNYRWDLDYVIPSNEGPNTDNRFIQLSYLQDKATTNGYTSIRDATLKQIIYGDSTTNPAGTIDFSYQAPFSDPPWTTAYSGSCAPLRCDDPTNYSGGLDAPLVMTTFTPVNVTSYVGTDGSSSNKDYSYAFSYDGSGQYACTDDYSGLSENCAGEHLLKSVTPTVYQNGSGASLPGLAVVYTSSAKDDYTDTTQTVPGGGDYSVKTEWDYLNFYDDLATGVGATITYGTAFNNSDGTPETSPTENRYDALYCFKYFCSGNYDHPSDRAWSAQVVTAITTLGSDSSGVSTATTQYGYRLANTGTYQGPPSQLCYPAGSDNACVGDTWMPASDNDWLDYYHSEFRGFAEVDILSPADELTVQTYSSTKGWGQPESDAHDYTAGALNDEKIYQGANPSAPLLQETQNIYAGYETFNGVQTDNSCNGDYSGTYPPCEVFLLSTRTTEYDGSNSSSPPWIEQDFTYDDYATGSGLQTGYHNLDSVVVSSSNAAGITEKSTYQVTDTTNNGWVYYNIHEPVHSEIDDSNGHVWACQNITYDEGVQNGVPQPAAGWPTTVTAYSNCANQSNTAIAAYTGYDLDGNPVVTVDGVGVANGPFYSPILGIQGKDGCNPWGQEYSPLAIMSPNWVSSYNYTTCADYNGNGLPVDGYNAFSQSTTTTYAPTQGDLPTSVEDANQQTTNYAYSYPGGDPTVDVSKPGDTPPSYTTQSQSVSSCTTSSTLPCFQIDTQSSAYPGAVTATFYDSLGRAVETITPVPTPTGGSLSKNIILSKTYALVQFTVYDDAAHSVFQSNPFTVETGWPDTTWIDPNNVTDYQGNKVYGTATFYDALGRPIAEQDPAFGSGQALGNPCPPLIINNAEANATDCAIYKLDTVSQISQDSGDTNTYSAVESIDPDNHVSESYADALGNTRYIINYSGAFSGTLTPNEQVVSLYNALNEPTNVTTTDLAPLNSQTISSVTVTMQYDDLGRLTQEVDPDRGTHSYTYDADSQILDDTSGSRTIGYNYDLLGRVGCEQSGAVTSDADGSCTTPNNAIIQNTYDTTEIGTQGVNDFPIGRLTKTQATTAYPEGGSTQSTEKFQYDQRGRVTTDQLKFNLPASWNVTNALPTYQMAFQYTDADQLSSSVSSTINGQGQSTPGYSAFQNYDQYTGVPIGLSTQTSSSPNLAALAYNTYGLVSGLTFQNGAGTEQAAEAFSYDGDLRPAEDTAIWGSGSGQSGQFFDETRSFDQASNLVSQTTTLAAVSGLGSTAGSETNDYCYDEQNRLVWASNSQQPSPTGAESCGSATAGTTFSGGSYTNTFSYTHLGQLWHAPVNGTGGYQQYLYCNSAAPHQVTNIVPAGQGYSCTNLPNAQHMSYAVGYDNWGNVTSRTYNQQTATLSYNKLDEMVEWQIPSANQAWYAYDSSGERTLQRTTIGSTTTMTVYAFGLEEYNYNGSGDLQSSTHYYTLGGRLIGELQQSGSTSTTNYFLTDNLGSVLAVFNSVSSSAALLSTQLYAPYGAARFTAGTPSNYTTKGYTGQYNDSVSGLDYYNARYYDPVSGVFLSADTVEGNDSGMNPYAYAGGNPATYSDPSGTMFNDEGEGGGGEIENGGTTAVASYSGDSGWEGGDWGDWGDTSSGPVTEPLPAVNVTQGNVTYAFDQTDGELTTTTTNADGSTTTAGYLTTDAAYATQYSAYLGAVAANDVKPPAAANSAILHHSTATPQTGSPMTNAGAGGAKPPSGGHPPTASSPDEPPQRPRMNPQNIGFTQNTCSNQGNGYTVRGNINALNNGSLTPEQLPVMKVFQATAEMMGWKMTKNGYTGYGSNLIEGQWYTLNNRRLAAYQGAGLTDVPVEIIDDIAKIQKQTWQFTTDTWGIGTKILGDPGC